VYRNREAKQKAFDQLLMKEMQRLSKLKIYG
jgi:hypothetical protein